MPVAGHRVVKVPRDDGPMPYPHRRPDAGTGSPARVPRARLDRTRGRLDDLSPPRLWRMLVDRNHPADTELRCDIHSVRKWIGELIAGGYVTRKFRGTGYSYLFQLLPGKETTPVPMHRGSGVQTNLGVGCIEPLPSGVSTHPRTITIEPEPRTGKLSAPEIVMWNRELERVEDDIRTLKNGYDSHQDWDADDKFALRELKKTRQDIRGKLGLP